MVSAEQFTGVITDHGEGPVWSPQWGGLACVDMLAGDVLTIDDGGGFGRHHLGTVAAVVRPRAHGGAIVAVEHGFVLTDADLAVSQALPPVLSDPAVRFNEGGCDPDGRFYCGSMAYDETPGAGRFVRLDPDGTVTTILESVSISNGFAFSPDHRLAYYNDTPTHKIDVFDYSAETGLTNRRTFAEIPAESGSPDGLTVDADGRVWTALYGGSAVHCYSAAGRLEEVISVPATQVTACTFGGPDGDELFITTSRHGLPAHAQPQAGALFRARVGVRGLPTLPFAG